MNCNSFSYGVEIEGVFSNTLIKNLKSKIEVKTKTDGSVQDDRIIAKYKLSSDDIVDNCQEINMGIFKKQSALMEVLTMVESQKLHFWDRSCGLHLHIKPKKDIGLIYDKIIDFAFLQNVENFAYENLCTHIKRRKSNTYCLPYKDLCKTVEDFQESEKYRFVRLHSNYKTMEFRFFTPCEHKCENIKTFLDYFIHFPLSSTSFSAKYLIEGNIKEDKRVVR